MTDDAFTLTSRTLGSIEVDPAAFDVAHETSLAIEGVDELVPVTLIIEDPDDATPELIDEIDDRVRNLARLLGGVIDRVGYDADTVDSPVHAHWSWVATERSRRGEDAPDLAAYVEELRPVGLVIWRADGATQYRVTLDVGENRGGPRLVALLDDDGVLAGPLEVHDAQPDVAP